MGVGYPRAVLVRSRPIEGEAGAARQFVDDAWLLPSFMTIRFAQAAAWSSWVTISR